MSDKKPCVLVTGYTGFLGKVVVEELCRLQMAGTLPLHRILVLVRPSKGLSARERFERSTKSVCFSRLDKGWQHNVEIVEGDLELPDMGLRPEIYIRMATRVTHIIHCAASIDFNLHLKKACSAIVDTALNILDFARNCPKLERFVDTSTAYVNPHRDGLIKETLGPFPWSGFTAEQLYEMIQGGYVCELDLLRRSGHTNTYTAMKCLAEHLVSTRRGSIPLSIVRPSIISNALQYPYPGYTDSHAAVCGVTALFGSGFLHVLESNMSTEFDIIPVDVVATHLIDESGLREYTPIIDRDGAGATSSLRIIHSVAGPRFLCPFEKLLTLGLLYFRQHADGRSVYWRYSGPRTFSFHWHNFWSQRLPLSAACLYLSLTRQEALLKRTKIVRNSVKQVHRNFAYFATNKFEFDTSCMLPESFNVDDYIELIASGVHKHLIKRELFVEDERERCIQKGEIVVQTEELCTAS